ncbi:MAG: FHA domain-containing protein [Candidatus Brocadiia bacterium]
MAKLIIRKTGAPEVQFNITNPVLTIGRAKEGGIILKGDIKVSRKHARLDFLDGTFFLSDLKSANGTYLNERLVKGRVALKDGDKVTVGDTDLIFFSEGGIIAGTVHKDEELVPVDPKSVKRASPAEVPPPRREVAKKPEAETPKPRARLDFGPQDVSTTKCPKCSAVIDVTNIPKGAKVGCARCKHIFVV